MASGQIFGLRPVPPGSAFATDDIVIGGSNPGESVPVWDFANGSDEYMDFYGVAEGYGSSGMTVSWKWSASAASSGNTVWAWAFRRLADDAEDVSSAHTYVFQTATSTAASSIGEIKYASVGFTDGAQIDSLADGEQFVLRAQRISGGMAGDAELWQGGVILKET